MLRMVLIIETVLPPIETKDLTAADVDKLTNDTRELMLQTYTALSANSEQQLHGADHHGSSTAVEI